MDDKKDDLTAVAVTASAIEKNLPQDNDHELEVTHEGDFGTKRDLVSPHLTQSYLDPYSG